MSVVYYIPTDDDELLVSTTAAGGKAHAEVREGKVSLCVLDERWPFHRRKAHIHRDGANTV